MRLRRRLARSWPYVVLLLLFSSVILTFVVFLKTKQLGPTSSSAAGFAGLLFGNDEELTNKDVFEREFGGKDRLPPSIDSMEKIPKSHTEDSLLNYFLAMYLDGVEISWLSEVNSRYMLLEAMRDFRKMMLETNIGIVNSMDKMSKTPVINSDSNPNNYDISMIEWITTLSKYSNKGMKLNFRDVETLQIAIPLLNTISDLLHAPVWIHADVLPGPNNADVKVGSVKLLEVVKEFPKVTLSLGWSTDWKPDANQLRYSWHDVINMARICAPIRQRVSFAIRAGFAARSIRQLKWLLSLASRFTVTIWTSKYDNLPISQLVHFRKHMDPKKTFYNLPQHFVVALKGIAVKSSDEVVEGGPKWDRNMWQPILLQSTSIAFMGAEQVVLDGPGSWLVSKKPYQPELQRTRTTIVNGKIQFLRHMSLKTSQAKVQLFIRSSGVNPPPESKVQGVCLTISDDGALTLSAENLKRASAFSMQSTAKLPRSDCYIFKLVDKGDGIPVYCEIRTSKCEPHEEDLNQLAVDLHLKVPYDSERQLFYVSLTASGGQDPILIEDLTVS